MSWRLRDVRFTPKSGHAQHLSQCPLSAIFWHSPPAGMNTDDIQNFLYQPKTTAQDFTVFSVTSVVMALTFTDAIRSGMS